MEMSTVSFDNNLSLLGTTWSLLEEGARSLLRVLVGTTCSFGGDLIGATPNMSSKLLSCARADVAAAPISFLAAAASSRHDDKG